MTIVRRKDSGARETLDRAGRGGAAACAEDTGERRRLRSTTRRSTLAPVTMMPRFRFSLRAFLLLLFIASLVGSNLFTSWQLHDAREQIMQLNKDLGRLVVADVNIDKVNLVAVPTYEDLLWRWRLRVPKGMSLYAHLGVGEIPPKGIPQLSGSSSGPIEEGEYLMTAAIRRNRENKWQFTVERKRDFQGGTASASSSVSIADQYAAWLTGEVGFGSSMAGGGGSTEVSGLGRPFELLRVRSFKTTSPGSSASTTQATDGVLLWLTKASGASK